VVALFGRPMLGDSPLDAAFDSLDCVFRPDSDGASGSVPRIHPHQLVGSPGPLCFEVVLCLSEYRNLIFT